MLASKLKSYIGGEDVATMTVSSSSNLSWLIRLRWLAVAIQLAVTVLGHGGLFPIGPFWVFVVVLTLTVITNFAARGFAKLTALTDAVTFVLLTIDVVLLTLLLWYSGGPANPLTLLYVVHVALGAVMVPPGLGWTVGALVVFCYGTLFVLPHPIGGTFAVSSLLLGSPGFRDHLLNQWWAFTGVAMLLAYFVTRVTSSLILRERELASFARRAARSEKMASLATLATGAAHELGTPLGTIGLVAKELQRAIDRDRPKAELLDDARLIASQVERCRTIIDSMRSEAGVGYEMPEKLALGEVMDKAREKLPPGYPDRLNVDGEFNGFVWGPRRSLCQALRNLLKNALDAGDDEARVRVNGELAGDVFRLEIRDQGGGMAAEVLDRVGEPFFTTKEAGRGMGLGLFVTQAVIERVGGQIELESELGHGTRVTVVLPLMKEDRL